MSEGIVTFLITKLGDFLLERGKELEAVKNEAEYVSDELAFMKAFLRLADAMEESDSALRLLVKKVRDVAYDTEDALDEFRLCLANDNGDALLLEEADLVGIEKPKKQLIERLLGTKSGREVVSVVGMGGLGKTTLVRRVYDDPDVKKNYKFRAWITVSQSYKTGDLLKHMIQQLFHVLRKPDPHGVEEMDYDKLMMIINKFLQQRKYLIVLDDVWHINAWDAFKYALPNNNHGSRKVAEKILGRCEGLPLAIVAISGVLATKDKNRIDEWEMVHRSLGAELEDNNKLKTILSLSYNDLPYYLKSCLLYFSIFPKGHPIERTRLARLWIAEGFVIEKEGATIEEVAGGYLNELLKRSLVQVEESTSDGRVKTCRIHDVLRESIILKARDQEFVAVAKEPCMMWPEKARRLSIHNASQHIQHMIHIPSRLRSLLMFWGVDSLSGYPKINLSYGGLSLLNVLDLQGAPLKEFPSEVVKPIPVEVPKFERDHDDHNYTKYGFKAPARIGCLHSVQKLCFIEAKQGIRLLMELGKLNQLRRLGIVKLGKKDGKALCSSIENLGSLRALSVTSIEENEIIDMQSLSSPPPLLQRLYLTGRQEKLPKWISSLHFLVKLVLKWTRLQDDPLVSIQHLPNLVHLEFVQVYDGERLHFKRGGFQRLRILGLNKLNRLKSITVQKGGIPCLQKLIILGCRLLRRVPFGIQHLPELKVLDFVDMPDDFIKRLRPNEGGGGDYLKIRNIPEVYCTHQINGNWEAYSVGSFKK
ncbi:hypothetical protein OIU78_014036, partial [Salix suchowensis]